MKVLITGGAGFIGSYTTRALQGRGHSVTVLDNFSAQVHTPDRRNSFTWMSIAGSVELVEGDVRDRSLLADLAPRFDAILHLAAETGTGQSMYDVSRYCDVNVGGTANLLEALVRHRGSVTRLVVASSRAIYGEGCYHCEAHGEVYPASRDIGDLQRGEFEPRCPKCGEAVAVGATPEDALVQPASVYAVTKLSQEQLVLSVAKSLGVSAIAMRYQNVYGPGQSLSNPYTGILSIFSREMIHSRPIEIFEDGLESRDFVHVEDVAQSNLAALELTGLHNVAVNVGTGVSCAVIDVARRLLEGYASRSELRVSGRFRAGDIRHNRADVSRLRSLIGFCPELQFEHGIVTFCAWARSQLSGQESSASGYRDAMQELESRGLMKGGRSTG